MIYADQSSSQTLKFSERLERFHAGMEFLLRRQPGKPSPSNRVTIYVVDNKRKVQDIGGIENKYVAGFYRPKAGATVALVPKIKSTGNKFILSAETVLMHEYAHHYLISSTSQAFPLWFQEGFAEFYASAKFGRDDSLTLGGQAVHRAYELAYSKEVPASLLLDTEKYLGQRSKSYDSFYGRSWALFHYLTFSDGGQEKLNLYQRKLIDGTPEIDAATQSFGDLEALDDVLDKYLRARRIKVFRIATEKLKFGEVKVSALSEGHAKMMTVILQSRTGVDEEQAQAVVLEARKIAAQFPNEAAVLAALAEAEFDSGHEDAAIAAADRALAIDTANVNALVQKGYALAEKAATSDDPETLWTEARDTFVALNRLENDHPIPLIWFYRTYVEQGERPTKLAKQGLEWALQLAPYDQGLRMTVAQQQADDEEYDIAIQTLGPLASSPHENGLTVAAGQMLKSMKDALAAQKSGDDA